MSAPQVKANTVHHGGFLWALAARLAPAIISGLASATASKIASSVLKKKKKGSRSLLAEIRTLCESSTG